MRIRKVQVFSALITDHWKTDPLLFLGKPKKLLDPLGMPNVTQLVSARAHWHWSFFPGVKKLALVGSSQGKNAAFFSVGQSSPELVNKNGWPDFWLHCILTPCEACGKEFGHCYQ